MWGRLSFIHVQFNECVAGEHYLIRTQTELIKCKFNGHFNEHNIKSCGWSHPTHLAPIERCYREYHYYYLISFRRMIQLQMESRAINKVLRQIIGDDAFTYPFDFKHCSSI